MTLRDILARLLPSGPLRPKDEEEKNAGIVLADLRLHHCRWVLPNGRFCGATRRDFHTSYCPSHAERVYQKPNPNARRYS